MPFHPEAYKTGKVEYLEKELNDLMNDKIYKLEMFEKTFYVHCKGGYRSMIAASILLANGISNFSNIPGGYDKIKKRLLGK